MKRSIAGGMLALMALTGSMAQAATPTAKADGFSVDLWVDSPLYDGPIVWPGARAAVEGRVSENGQARILVDCGNDRLQGQVTVEVRRTTGSKTAQLHAVFAAQPQQTSACLTQAVAMVPTLEMNADLAPGTSTLTLTHPDYPQVRYDVKVVYTPSGG